MHATLIVDRLIFFAWLGGVFVVSVAVLFVVTVAISWVLRALRESRERQLQRARKIEALDRGDLSRPHYAAWFETRM